MTSPHRLLLLLLACFVPILGVQVYAQYRVQQDHAADLDSLALHQAELANGAIAGIVDGVRQLATAAAQFSSVAAAAPDCTRRLATVQQGTPSVRFLATFDASGRPLCTSLPALAGPAPNWAQELLRDGQSSTGSFQRLPRDGGGFLPIGVRLAASPNQPLALIVAGLDLEWLERHLAQLHVNAGATLRGAALYVADHDGTVLLRTPSGAESAGQKLPMRLLNAVRHAQTGVFHLPAPSGDQIVATLPVSAEPGGLAVIEALPPSAPLAGLLRGAWLELAVTIGCLLLALAALWIAARQRSATMAPTPEAVAARANARDQQERLAMLQAQLAQRDRTVSESNNRLQVEIAERRKAEAALHRAQKQQVIGRLTAGIAHDFNNMLATMLGNLELMERRVDQAAARLGDTDAARLRSLVARAMGAVQHGAKLVSQLLAFARRQREQPRPADLNVIVTEFALMASSALGRRIRVETNLAKELWPAVVDRSQLESAILNCCLNARDAMPEGGQLTLATENRVVARDAPSDDPAPGDYVAIRISDTGTGMAPEVLQRAFEPLFTTRESGGTGLGLTQVQEMAEEAGGLVRLSSKPGEGTTVTMLLPRAVAQAGADAGPAQAEAEDSPHQSCIVLTVDDDIAVRQVTVDMLREMGCEVLQAGGGPEALTLLDSMSRWPDVVLLDYAMPGMNGVQLARALRQRRIGVPMALVTGYAELADRENAGNLFDGLLRKPFTIRELSTLLQRLRDSRRQNNVVPLRMHGAA